MMSMPNKLKHLDMIKAIIERMSKNCFQLKSWTMTLVVAVSAYPVNHEYWPIF